MNRTGVLRGWIVLTLVLAGGAWAGVPASPAARGGILGGFLPAPDSSTRTEQGAAVQPRGGMLGSWIKPPAPEPTLTDQQRFERLRAEYGTHFECEQARRRRTRYAILGGGLAGMLIGAGAHAAAGSDFRRPTVYGFLALEAIAGAFLGYRLSPLIAPDCSARAWETVARTADDGFHEAEIEYQDCRLRRGATIAGWTAGLAAVAGLMTSMAGRKVARTSSGRRVADLSGAAAAVLGGAFLGWPLGRSNATPCGEAPRRESFSARQTTGETAGMTMVPAASPSATVNP